MSKFLLYLSFNEKSLLFNSFTHTLVNRLLLCNKLKTLITPRRNIMIDFCSISRGGHVEGGRIALFSTIARQPQGLK